MAAHDEKEQARLTKLQRQFAQVKKLRIDNAITNLASDSEGRELLWWLLQIGKVGTQPFTSNALTTAFQCGELNVGQQVLDRILEVDPAIYVRMQQEQQADYGRLVSANNSDERSVAADAPGDGDNRPGGYDLDLGAGAGN